MEPTTTREPGPLRVARSTVARYGLGYEIEGLAALYQAPDGTVAAHPDRPDTRYTVTSDEAGKHLTISTADTTFTPTVNLDAADWAPGHRFPHGPLVVVTTVIGNHHAQVNDALHDARHHVVCAMGAARAVYRPARPETVIRRIDLVHHHAACARLAADHATELAKGYVPSFPLAAKAREAAARAEELAAEAEQMRPTA